MKPGPKTPPRTAWKKGQSGNPAGRRREAPPEVREAAKAHTKEAILTLVEVMRAKKAMPSARVTAATALLDRAWGKPESTGTLDVTMRASLLDVLGLLPAAVVAEDGDEAVH